MKNHEVFVVIIALAIMFCFAESASANNATVGYAKTRPSELMLKKAKSEFGSGNFQQAALDLDRVILSNPKSAEAFYLRACCKHLQKDYLGALKDCNRAIAIEPNGDPVFYFQRAVSEYRLQKLHDCISDCNFAIKHQPKLYSSYIYRAHAKADLGDKQGALKDCNIYLRNYPNDAKAMQFKQRLLADWVRE